LAAALEHFFLGQTAEAIRMVDALSGRVSTMSRRDREEVAAQLVVCSYFGWVRVDDAFDVLDRAARLRGESIGARAHDLRVRGALLGMTGRFDEARSMFQEAERLYDELGAPRIKITSSQVVAETLRLEGRLDEAERVLREMNDAYDAIGETGFNSTVCGVLAHVLCDQGRLDEAEAYIVRSREMAAEDDFASQALWRTVQARVLAHRGDLGDALTLADEAAAITARTDYLDWQGQGHEVRGDVLAAAGRAHDARRAYETALERFERKGNVVAAARVRYRIAALVSS
jgi:ATP/maltotriose-dependent transcriptional regulator MalT